MDIVARPVSHKLHPVTGGVIVQVVVLVQLILASGQGGYLYQEAEAKGSYLYNLYTPEGGDFESDISLGETQGIITDGKVTAIIPCDIDLWYVQEEEHALEICAGPGEEILADVVVAQGSQHQLLHLPVSIAVASGLIREDLKAETTQVDLLSGQAVVTGIITGGVYYAAPNGTERFVPVSKDFTFVLTDPAIQPGMCLRSDYQLETGRGGKVIKIFLSLDWLIIEKRVISLPLDGRIGGRLRVNKFLGEEQVLAQFKERFALGEEFRKIRDYRLAWLDTEVKSRGEFLLVSSRMELELAGVTPLEEVKEKLFTHRLEKISTFPDLPKRAQFCGFPQTQYLRVELLPRNQLGVLGQVKFSIIAYLRETLELPAYTLLPVYEEREEELEAVYRVNLALPRGFTKLTRVEVKPQDLWAGAVGGSAQVHGDLVIEATVENKHGQTRQLSEPLPFWHFGRQEAVDLVWAGPARVSILEEQVVKEASWKGMINKWFLRLAIKVAFTAKTLRWKDPNQQGLT